MTNAERFSRLFRGYETRFGQYVVATQESSGKRTGRADTVNRPIEPSDYEQHLAGEVGIGVIPLTEDDLVFFAALDIDTYDGSLSHHELAIRLQQLPVVLTRSKSNGAHVWMFSRDGVPAALAREALKHWAAELGFAGCEIFPKQSSRAGKADVGNWINLPYFGDSRNAVLVRRMGGGATDTIEASLEQFLAYAEQTCEHVTSDFLSKVAPTVRSQRDHADPTDDWFDGPPCLQRLFVGDPKIKDEEAAKPQLSEGGRNTAFFNASNYLFRKYGNENTVRDVLSQINGKLGAGLPQAEIDRCSKQGTKEFGFQCQVSPLKDFCNRSLCLKRRHGVGSRAKDQKIEVSGVTRILTDPVLYAFNANGKRVSLSYKQLLHQKTFQEELFAATNEVWPMMRNPDFDSFVAAVTANADEIDGPTDTTPADQVREHFVDFLEMKKSDRLELFERGRAVIRDDRIYFKRKAFAAYLQEQRVAMSSQYVSQVLLELGVTDSRETTTLGGKTRRAWSAPLSLLEEES